MNKAKTSWRSSARIVWAITAKDIAGAIKDKTVMTMIIAALFIVASSQALPFLINWTVRDTIVVYDMGNTQLTQALEESDQFTVYPAESQSDMEDLLLQTGADMLAIMVPADFDQRSDNEDPVVLPGYVLWSNRGQTDTLITDLEQWAAGMGQPITIDITNHYVYPSIENMGVVNMFVGTVVNLIFIIGVFIVPYLIFEEKKAKTLDVMLVSPATLPQIALGKVLAGLFYGLITTAVAFLMNRMAVVHWGLAGLMVVVGVAISTMLGLFLGLMFQDYQQMALWIGMPAIVFLLPTMLSNQIEALPDILQTVISWLPTVALSRGLTYTLYENPMSTSVLSQAGIIALWCVGLFGLIVWRMRQLDR